MHGDSSMIRFLPRALLGSALVLGLTVATASTGCSSSGNAGPTPGNAADGSTANCSTSVAQATVPTAHRATAPTCAPSTFAYPDAGPPSCTSDGECADAGAPAHCLNGTCSFDACLTDADCAGGGVCICQKDFYGGNASHGNVCVQAACHVDSDCGTKGYCSPTLGYCGAFERFDCHTAADRCVDPTTDCAACGLTNPACTFSPQVGYFVCSQGETCSG
jgi:hypothetical protein